MKVSFGVFPFGVGVYGTILAEGYDRHKGFWGYFRLFVNGFVKGVLWVRVPPRGPFRAGRRYTRYVTPRHLGRATKGQGEGYR